LLVALTLHPAQGRAACLGVCGDVNNLGTVTSLDIIELIDYIYSEGASPVPDCADVDDYLLTSARDIVWMINYVFKAGPPPDCAPQFPPLTANPNNAYIVSCSPNFPANTIDPNTTFPVEVFLLATLPTHALTLPLLISVGGSPAASLGAISLGSDFTTATSKVAAYGSPPNSVLFGYVSNGSLGGGLYTLATIDVTMPSSAVMRPITIDYTTMPPFEGGMHINYPLLVDNTMITPPTSAGLQSDPTQGAAILNAWEPVLIDCPILVKGDINVSGTVTSADIILLVNYVFKSGPEPEPIVEAGDINCNGTITSADIIALVNFVFKSGPAPCNPCTDMI